MDLSSKIVIGIAIIAGTLFGAVWIRITFSNWYARRSKRTKSAILFGPVILLSVASISTTKEPFWLGHIIGWSILWGIIWYALFGEEPTEIRQQSGGSTTLQQQQGYSPGLSFADVIGMQKLKDELGKHADEIFNGGKNGILFHGAPGNGKTMMAEAFAGELQSRMPKDKYVVFMPVSMATLASRWLNQTTEQLNDLFVQAAAAAKTYGACVLFIDEIDSVLVSRDTIGPGGTEVSQQVNVMLTLLVNFRNFKQNGIVIVAATNFLDKLDSAAIREGRFDFKTEITAPDEPARIALLMQSASEAALSQKTAERVASRWEGFGVARLRHVGQKAAKLAKASNRDEVTFDDLMAALRDAQGCRGLNLPENTASLDELHFDEELTSSLKGLARRMTKIAEIEAMGGSVPKGVLFFGPPGTGKTAVAKALAKSSGWAFLSTTGQRLMNDANEFDRLITKASDLRPCIVFIDEADDILADRATNPHGKSATNNLLALMDGDRALKDVMFVAATNFEDALDAAAVRGGRFAEHYEFRRPTEDALVSIIRAFMASKANAPWSPEFTPEAAAAILKDFSPADAKDRMQKAINRVVANLGEEKIALADLEAVSG